MHKPNVRKFEKQKVYSYFKDIPRGADLADMLLISKYNEGLQFVLSVIDIFSKYASVVLLKDKKGITTTNAFQRILDESGHKLNKIWEDKGSEFYNKSVKSWLQDNDIEMFSTHNEGKSVVAERFITTLRNKFYQYTTSVLKNVHIDK